MARGSSGPLEPPGPPDFRTICREQFGFVWRTLRHLGVSTAYLDDAVQDVFLVAQRKLREFDGSSSVRTWLYGISRYTALEFQRGDKRRQMHEPVSEDLTSGAPKPDEQAETQESARFVATFLDSLDEDKRDVFFLIELEQMSAPEVAEAIGVKLNTVYSRLRAARQAFQLRVRQRGGGDS
jgi:RNA polymerase sigma-70 factor (ECF subfamily)